MNQNINQIEELLRKTDFSKETDLKPRLWKKIEPVHHTSLEKLMEEEGIIMMSSHEKKRKQAKVRSAVKENRFFIAEAF